MILGFLRKTVSFYQNNKLTYLIIRRNLSEKNHKIQSNSNLIKKFLIGTMGIGLSTVAYIFKTNSNVSDSYMRREKLEKLQNQIVKSIETNSLREKFNFIDKVAKKCIDGVVYIEILDPRKIDPVTNQPLVLSNGSGFVFREDGWILTNAHVVINKPHAIICVKFPDGTSYKVTVKDADMNIDLALLKIDSQRKLFPALKMGNSIDVAVGEWVVALGSPLSLSHSVTAGVVSSTAREAEELGLRSHSMRYLQTDASITFGNSGGPLVNLDGSVIGINNLRITAGISFAIPIDYAKKFISRSMLTLHNVENVKPPDKFLGIATITLSKSIINEILSSNTDAALNDLKEGVFVYKVINGTIGQRSGLHAGDIITHINDVPISVASDIYSTCNSLDDKKYTINLLRKGVKKKITLTK